MHFAERIQVHPFFKKWEQDSYCETETRRRENKNRAQKINTYPADDLPAYVVSFCARLFGGFTLHRWEAMYPVAR